MIRLLLGFVFCGPMAYSAELSGVSLADKIQVGPENLQLNGFGLRMAKRFGKPIKVYVAGLYIKEKTNNFQAILQAKTPRRLVLHFLMPVDRNSLVDSYRKSYTANCVEDCNNTKLFQEFRDLVASVRKGNEVRMTFSQEGFEMETTGPFAKRGNIKSQSLVKNVLSIFLNDTSPPTPELRRALLGGG